MKVIHQLIMDLLLSDELQSIAEAQSLKVKGRNNSLPRRLGMVLLVLGCIRKWISWKEGCRPIPIVASVLMI